MIPRYVLLALCGVLSTPLYSATLPEYARPFVLAGDAPDGREAMTRWFREGRMGLFVHYGISAHSPGGKFAPAPPGFDWNRARAQFKAEAFDAEALASLAKDAGMAYICFTPYHGGGPALWKSAHMKPNTAEHLPASRDLLAELAQACRSHGLGLFLYVHITLSQSDDASIPRNAAIWEEWLTAYGPLAGLWLDSSRHLYKNREQFTRLPELYARARTLQPHAMISFCHGVLGEEDYLTFEHRIPDWRAYRHIPGEIKNRLEGKPLEMCTTLQLDKPGGSGLKMWFDVADAYHRTPDEAWDELVKASASDANLLLNTGLRADGSVHPTDASTLRSLGRLVAERGFPPRPSVPSASPASSDPLNEPE